MSEVTIRCRLDGPLLVEGPAVVVDHLGNAFPLRGDKKGIALCRCGESKQRPFCDGSHRACGFQAGETAPVESE